MSKYIVACEKPCKKPKGFLHTFALVTVTELSLDTTFIASVTNWNSQAAVRVHVGSTLVESNIKGGASKAADLYIFSFVHWLFIWRVYMV